MAELDGLGILWNTVSKEYNIGTYEEFSEKMQDREKRKAFYDTVGKKYNLGKTFIEFENKVKKKEQEELPSSVEKTGGVLPSSLNSPELKLSGLTSDMKGNIVDKPSSIFQNDIYANMEYNMVKNSEKKQKYNQTIAGQFDWDRNTATKMAAGFANGVASLPKQVINGLDYLNDLFDETSKYINPALPEITRFSDYVIDKVKNQHWYKEYTDNLKINQEEILSQGNIVENIRNKDYKGALDSGLMQMSMSLPVTIAALFGGPTGLAAIGVTSAGEKYDEIKDTDKSTTSKLLNSSISGGLEVLTESITQGYGTMLKKIYLKEGAEEGVKLISKGLKGWLERPLKQMGIWSAPIGEGLSEGINGVSQYLSDVAFGYDKWDPQKAKDIFINDASVGGLMGAGFTLMGTPGQLRKTRSELSSENERIRNSVNTTKPAEERDKYLSDIINEIPEEYAEPVRKQIAELLIKKDELQQKQEEAGEKIKPVFDKQIKAVDNAISEVVNAAEGFAQDTETKGDQLKQVSDEKAEKKQGVPEKPEAAQQEQPEPVETEKGQEEETVKPKEFKVTRIAGLGMGQSQASGTYYSTEEGNRYETVSGKKAKRETVVVENPIEFDQNKNEFTNLRNEVLQKNTDKFEEVDFDGATIPERITVDDLSESGLNKLGEFITEDLRSKGHDSILFTGEGEGELVVFPKEKINQENIENVETEETSQQISGTEGLEGQVAGVEEPVAEQEITQPIEQKSKEQLLADASTVNEMLDLVDKGVYSPMNKEWYTKKAKLVQEGKYERDEKIDNIKKLIEKDSQKKTATAGFFGEKTKQKKEDVFNGFKRLFTKEGGLPKSVFEANRDKTGAVNAITYNANKVASNAIKEAKKAFGVKKLTDEQADLIMDVLEKMGTDQATKSEQLSRLPEPLRPHIENMRNTIDKLTKQIQDTGILSKENQVRFDANTGFYLTRAYRKQIDPNYSWDTIPNEVKEKAAEALMQYYPDATEDKIMGILKNIVDDKGFTSFIGMEKPIGKMDLGITKQRSQFLTDNPAIRELMGEIRDPFNAFAISVAKMSELAERAKFLNKVTDIGLKEGFLKEDIEGEYRKPIGVDKIIGFNIDGVKFAKSSKALSPLNEYYTTPEIAQAFEQFNDATRIQNKIAQWYMKAITYTKFANTVFSVGSQMRNIQSNGLNLVANGAWNITDTIPELTSRLKSKELRTEFITELKQNTIVGDNIEAGAMLKNIEKLSGYMDRLYAPESDLKKGLRNTQKFFLDMYQMGDDVFKSYRYVSEYMKYKGVYEKQGLSTDEALMKAKDKAKDILHDTQTYYSNLPKFMDTLRMLPLSGTFVTFPYLTTVNLFNTCKLAAQEMSKPETFAIGLQRSAGTLAAVSGLGLMALMVNRGNGLDDDDMSDIRRALPEYWKNDIITVKKVNGDGKFEYSNTSYLDFYNAVTTPMLSIVHAYAAKGDVDVGDFVHAIGIFLEPYSDRDILFQRTINALNNWDNEKKEPIYNESLPTEKRIWEIAKYLGETVTPATLRDIKTAYEIRQRGGDANKFIKGRMTGRQTRELDLTKSFGRYNFPIAKQKIENAAKIYNNVKYDNAMNEDAKERARETASKQINYYIQELHKDYMAFQRQGANIDEMNKSLSQSYGGYKMNRIVRGAIIMGQEVYIDKDGEIIISE